MCRAEAYNDTLFEAWVETALAPPLLATLHLVQNLQKLGYSIIFLTGRAESQRAVTVKNLANAGYKGWADLILRYVDIYCNYLLFSQKRFGIRAWDPLIPQIKGHNGWTSFEVVANSVRAHRNTSRTKLLFHDKFKWNF